MFFGNKISTQLNIIFLLAVIVPISIGMFISYDIATNSLKDVIFSNINTIAKNKVNAINQHIQEREVHIELLATNPLFVSVFNLINKHKNESATTIYQKIPIPVKNYLKDYKEKNNFYDLFLINPAGDIVYTVILEEDFGTNLTTGKYSNTPLAEAFHHSITKKKQKLTHFVYYKPSATPAAFISFPIYKNNNYLGSITLQVNADEILSFVTDYTGLGLTGEVILASKNNDGEIQFLTPHRHDKKTFQNKKAVHKPRIVKFGMNKSKAMQNALSGKIGEGIYTDYRNKEVIASWRYLPDLEWGMVVKMDKDEALAPIKRLTIWYGVIAIFTLCMMLLMSYMSKSITSPIYRLVRTANKMKQGNLSVRSTMTSKDPDEMIVLSEAFNDLADAQQKHIQYIEKSKLQTEQIISNASQGIITIDQEQIIILANQQAESIFKYKTGELLGKNLSILIPDSIGNDTHRTYVDNYSKMGAKPRAEDTHSKRIVNALDKEGNVFPIDASLSKMKLDNDWYFTVFVTDITERLKQEEELIVAKDNAEKANAAKSLFLAKMSHELRTPMHGILSFADFGLTKSKDLEDKKIPFYFQQIDESGQRLLNLLNDLLDLTKLEAGKTDFIFTQQSFTAVVKLVLQEQQLRLNEKDMDVIWESSENEFIFEFDRQSMIQVMTNLISNAIKFNKPGQSLILNINMQNLENGEQEFCVTVRDHGIGIPEEELGTIFNRFEQSSRTITDTAGTGLGLPICLEIIQAHQGKIWAQNHPEGGAVFNFCLPCKHSL